MFLFAVACVFLAVNHTAQPLLVSSMQLPGDQSHELTESVCLWKHHQSSDATDLEIVSAFVRVYPS